MATRYSRRLYGRRYYRRYPTYRRSATVRRAIGNRKAASQQKDTSRVNLNVQHKFSTSYIHQVLSGENNTFNCGVYAVNIWDLLRKSEFYQSYASMYDQVKIDGIKIKLTPIEWTFNPGTAGPNGIIANMVEYRAVSVVTAWDRTGLSEEQIKVVANKILEKGTEQEGVGIIGKANPNLELGEYTDPETQVTNNVDGLYITINDDISTYSSAVTKSLTYGSSFNLSRYLYPSNIAEKSYYANTSDLDEWYKKYDSINGRYYGIKQPAQVYGLNQFDDEDIINEQIVGYLGQSPACESNPCYLLEDSSVPFKPTLLVGVQTPRSTSAIDALGTSAVIQRPITFNLEADIQVTFRGLRKARMVESDKVNIEDNKHKTITHTGTNIVEPSEGFDAMAKVTLDVQVPQRLIQPIKTQTITSNTSTNIEPDEGFDGIQKVVVTTNVPNQTTTKTITTNGNYTPESPYIGFNQVTVNIPPDELELWVNKRFTSNLGLTTLANLMNDSTKRGVDKNSTLTIDVPTPLLTQISNYPITRLGNITIPIPDGYDGVDSISLNVNVPLKSNQTITTNGTYTIKDDDENLDDLEIVPYVQTRSLRSSSANMGTFKVNIPTPTPILQSISKTLNTNLKTTSTSISNYVVVPSSGYDGISSFTIPSFTSGKNITSNGYHYLSIGISDTYFADIRFNVNVSSIKNIILSYSFASEYVNYTRTQNSSINISSWNTKTTSATEEITLPSSYCFIRIDERLTGYYRIMMCCSPVNSSVSVTLYQNDIYTMFNYYKNVVASCYIHFCISNASSNLGEFVYYPKFLSSSYTFGSLNPILISKNTYSITI